MNHVMPSTDTSLPSYGLTLLRISLGVMWISHALLKILVFTVPGTIEFFQSVGFPGFLVYPVLAVELTGGAALILGIYARQVSLALVPVLMAATTVHIGNGWVFTSPGGGWEYPVFLILASLVLWMAGDGALALRRSDHFAPGS